MIVREGLPEPAVDERNMPFLEAAGRSQLVLPRCRACGNVMGPPVAECRRCISDDLEWVSASGRGTLHSYIEYHKLWLKEFEPYMPYVVAIVELEEGARMISDLLLDEGQTAEVGDAVTVAFEARGDMKVPVFVLAKSEE